MSVFYGISSTIDRPVAASFAGVLDPDTFSVRPHASLRHSGWSSDSTSADIAPVPVTSSRHVNTKRLADDDVSIRVSTKSHADVGIVAPHSLKHQRCRQHCRSAPTDMPTAMSALPIRTNRHTIADDDNTRVNIRTHATRVHAAEVTCARRGLRRHYPSFHHQRSRSPTLIRARVRTCRQ